MAPRPLAITLVPGRFAADALDMALECRRSKIAPHSLIAELGDQCGLDIYAASILTAPRHLGRARHDRLANSAVFRVLHTTLMPFARRRARHALLVLQCSMLADACALRGANINFWLD